MKETLKYKYVMFPQINDREKKNPMGTIARKYILPVILIFLRPSISVVVLARIWVIIVPEVRCQHVRKIGKGKFSVLGSRMYLLKRIRPELNPIHTIT